MVSENFTLPEAALKKMPHKAPFSLKHFKLPPFTFSTQVKLMSSFNFFISSLFALDMKDPKNPNLDSRH